MPWSVTTGKAPVPIPRVLRLPPISSGHHRGRIVPMTESWGSDHLRPLFASGVVSVSLTWQILRLGHPLQRYLLWRCAATTAPWLGFSEESLELPRLGTRWGFRSLLIFVYSDPEVDCGIFKHIPIFVVGFWITYEFSIFYPLQDDDESVPTLAMAYPKLLMMWGWFHIRAQRDGIIYQVSLLIASVLTLEVYWYSYYIIVIVITITAIRTILVCMLLLLLWLLSITYNNKNR